MTKPKYDPYLLHKLAPLRIIGLQTDDIPIFAKNKFATTQKDDIKIAKILAKQYDHFKQNQLVQLNEIKIELHLHGCITSSQESHTNDITF